MQDTDTTSVEPVFALFTPNVKPMKIHNSEFGVEDMGKNVLRVIIWLSTEAVDFIIFFCTSALITDIPENGEERNDTEPNMVMIHTQTFF